MFLQKRRKTQIWSGYWEFPGGKIKDGENPAAALARELHEETGVIVKTATPWLRRLHHYPQGKVEIHFFRVWEWRNTPAGKEGQQCRWVSLNTHPKPMLPANRKIWKWLNLPPVCAVTAAEIFGVRNALQKLENSLQQGLRLVQLRDKNLPPQERLHFAKAAVALTRRHGALLLINDNARLAKKVGANGVHLSSGHLNNRKTKPLFKWAAASCHNDKELAKAAKLNLDFVVLSPVKKTLTHVDAAPLGWKKFAALSAGGGIPTYALGGMTLSDLETAQKSGAQGVAMMRKAWE